MKKHGQAAALRQVVPALFVLALALCALVASGVTAWPLAAARRSPMPARSSR